MIAIPGEIEIKQDTSEAQIQARVAWYYYVGGLTQQEIADRLGLTRNRVNRIVGQARADGLVRIEVLTAACELRRARRAPEGPVRARRSQRRSLDIGSCRPAAGDRGGRGHHARFPPQG